MRSLRCVIVAVGIAFVVDPSAARAQYRDNGLLVEAGVQSFEMLPYTLMTVGGTEAFAWAWRRGRDRYLVPPLPAGFMTCRGLILSGRPFPCQNAWFRMTDGVHLAVGYQRVIGDLLLDWSESPIIRNIVVSYRSGLGLSANLPTLGWPLPLAALHQQGGIRLNFADEKLRPFAGATAGLTVIVDPYNVFRRWRSNDDVCARQAAGEETAPGDICMKDGVAPPGSPVSLHPSLALFAMNAFPVILDVRPEAGIEWFFREDISVQFALSGALYGTVLPQFLVQPPFVGFSTRATGALVAYF